MLTAFWKRSNGSCFKDKIQNNALIYQVEMNLGGPFQTTYLSKFNLYLSRMYYVPGNARHLVTQGRKNSKK